MRGFFWSLVAFCLVALIGACRSSPPEENETLFTPLPSDSTGITFTNALKEGPGFNVLAYDYLYNGGGVAAGDLNNNGLPDLYFTANMGPNQLYLNQGDFRFEEVTQVAGVRGQGGWTTGVTMADVNGDGRLDIYVCRSGDVREDRRRNELYINQGVNDDGIPVFEEMAAEYGIDSPAYSTHATFFDYDQDGDLDLYLLNHPTREFARFDVSYIKRQRDSLAGDKLFRNDEGTFTDVSEEAGIMSNPISYGLSATVSDINRDGWPDVYVANDYIEDDYLYINQGDGTFEESARSHLDYTSYSSMGADIADYNNDGWPDIYTLDMMAENNRRQKLLKGPEDFRFYRNMLSQGFYYQFMRNMLHLNGGDSTFSEIGQLAGVSNTDWSWAALFADFDLDGHKDLYVTNGFRRDYTNLDFLNFELFPARKDKERDPESYELVQEMPSTPIANYVFRNAGDLAFEKKSAAWGVGQEGFSNGAAYADLDGDGDLDLVTSNIDAPASVYRNNADRQTDHHYLQVELQGENDNRFGIGAKVQLETPDGETLYQEQMPARGYQSSVEPVLTFGLGAAETVDLTVIWPDQRQQKLADVTANQTITLRQTDAGTPPSEQEASTSDPLVTMAGEDRGLTFAHRENAFVDFEREPLLPHMLSRLGPALACGDVNGDDREDLYVGGARGQRPALFLQRADDTFERASVSVFSMHRGYEDVAATFVDVDGDGALDLYVVSGGNDSGDPTVYQDRVYLNDGTGGFRFGSGIVPTIESSGGVVVTHDYDGDGDQDLFVGGRVVPGAYPLSPRSYLLENRNGRFEDVTRLASEALLQPGMVTDALFEDLDGDGTAELVLAGEWMPIRVFRYRDDGTFVEATSEMGLDQTGGWWYALAAGDLDGDGDAELVAGNRGQNAQVQARPEEPASIYGVGFSRDGITVPIMSHYLQGEEYPVFWRDELIEQVPHLDEVFPTYERYAEATMEEVLAALEASGGETGLHLQAHTFATSLFDRREDGTFRRQSLPVRAQFSPTRGIVVGDIDGNGRLDMLLAGNDFTVRPQWGRANAGKGVVLINRGNLRFEALTPSESGFFTPHDVRDIVRLSTPQGALIVVGNNNEELQVFERVVSPPGVAMQREQ